MGRSLLSLWMAGVAAVRGADAVRASLDAAPCPAPARILAVGKAAADMALAARAAYPDVPTLVVTKHGHGHPGSGALPADVTVIEAGHPIPDAASLAGGAALAAAVAQCAAGDHLLVLVSGGASAVAEHLPDDMTLADWQAETQAMMASGADIHAINTRRKQISQIKGGRLLAGFRGASVTVLAISDVEGDAIDVIGSGIGAAPDPCGFAYEARIVASNAIARAAIAAQIAGDPGAPPVIENSETLYDDVDALAPRIAQRLKGGPPGLYIMGGEPTVLLPDTPGRGGRNQALALLIAREIAGTRGLEVLVAGTDGTDGPTPDAGALVDGGTWRPAAEDALRRADAGTFLATREALITTGPTGTNVMDVLIARKS